MDAFFVIFFWRWFKERMGVILSDFLKRFFGWVDGWFRWLCYGWEVLLVLFSGGLMGFADFFLDDVIISGQHLAVSRTTGDVQCFVVGDINENEILLLSVLNTLYYALSQLLMFVYLD
mgnify:CR=1 FL=1